MNVVSGNALSGRHILSMGFWVMIRIGERIRLAVVFAQDDRVTGLATHIISTACSTGNEFLAPTIEMTRGSTRPKWIQCGVRVQNTATCMHLIDVLKISI